MIVDTHIHFWQPATEERPYDPGATVLGDDPLLAEDALRIADQAGADFIVQVTPSMMGFDNRYAVEAASRYPDRIAVFGRIDPAVPDVRDRLIQWSAEPGARGVRLTFFEGARPDHWSRLWPAFWEACQDLGVPVAIYAPNDPVEHGALAERYPDLTIFVDHCALGRIPRPDLWSDVLDLERFANLTLKVSFFPQADGGSFPFARGASMLREVYERFGAARLMWGSNYPPVQAVCSYLETIDFIRNGCEFLTEPDRSAILGGTAERVLQLGR